VEERGKEMGIEVEDEEDDKDDDEEGEGGVLQRGNGRHGLRLITQE
jgi:hypothetical protein